MEADDIKALMVGVGVGIIIAVWIMLMVKFYSINETSESQIQLGKVLKLEQMKVPINGRVIEDVKMNATAFASKCTIGILSMSPSTINPEKVFAACTQAAVDLYYDTVFGFYYEKDGERITPTYPCTEAKTLEEIEICLPCMRK